MNPLHATRPSKVPKQSLFLLELVLIAASMLLRVPARAAQEPSVTIGSVVCTNYEAKFLLTGPPGTPCVVQASSNLTHWVPLVTNTLPAGGSMWVSDPASLQSRRFYRAIAATGQLFNDQFVNRHVIPPSGGVVFGTNVNATKELGEPNHAGNAGGKSLWWTWTAGSSGLVTITTDGSTFDTLLGVYQGSAVGSLVATLQDDDSGSGRLSRVIFNAVAGSTYQIAVDGFSGMGGTVRLAVKPGILNDSFSEPLQLSGAFDFVTGHTAGASLEPGEPYHWTGTGGASAWWTWQALSSGPVMLMTGGSSFDTVLAAYTGNSVGGLSLVASNNDAGAQTSMIQFNATAGTVYRIAVDGVGGATGSVNLIVQQQY